MCNLHLLWSHQRKKKICHTVRRLDVNILLYLDRLKTPSSSSFLLQSSFFPDGKSKNPPMLFPLPFVYHGCSNHFAKSHPCPVILQDPQALLFSESE